MQAERLCAYQAYERSCLPLQVTAASWWGAVGHCRCLLALAIEALLVCGIFYVQLRWGSKLTVIATVEAGHACAVLNDVMCEDCEENTDSAGGGKESKLPSQVCRMDGENAGDDDTQASWYNDALQNTSKQQQPAENRHHNRATNQPCSHADSRREKKGSERERVREGERGRGIAREGEREGEGERDRMREREREGERDTQMHGFITLGAI